MIQFPKEFTKNFPSTIWALNGKHWCDCVCAVAPWQASFLKNTSLYTERNSNSFVLSRHHRVEVFLPIFHVLVPRRCCCCFSFASFFLSSLAFCSLFSLFNKNTICVSSNSHWHEHCKHLIFRTFIRVQKKRAEDDENTNNNNKKNATKIETANEEKNPDQRKKLFSFRFLLDLGKGTLVVTGSVVYYGVNARARARTHAHMREQVFIVYRFHHLYLLMALLPPPPPPSLPLPVCILCSLFRFMTILQSFEIPYALTRIKNDNDNNTNTHSARYYDFLSFSLQIKRPSI